MKQYFIAVNLYSHEILFVQTRRGFNLFSEQSATAASEQGLTGRF